MEQLRTTRTDQAVAVGISLLALLFLFSFVVVPGLLWLGHFPQGDGVFTSIAYLAVILVVFVAPGVGSICLSSRRAQFHACFWSGLGVLLATFLCVVHIIRNEPDDSRTDAYLAAISFAALSIMVGQALLMTALLRDPLTVPRSSD